MKILGVDFSGAADPSRKIWVAEAVGNDGALRIVSCRSMREIDSTARGADVYARLRDLLAQPDVIAGLDFPFSLPNELVTDADWAAFVRAFPTRYRSADAFQSNCRDAARGKELRRPTDRENRTPFAPYNLRMYRQTYHGIANVLAPLIAVQKVHVQPMQTFARRRANLVEVCPASLLQVNEIRRPYKGRGPAPRRHRKWLIRWLSEQTVIVEPALAAVAADDHEADALDSILAAFITWKCLPEIRSATRPGDQEGKVYNWRSGPTHAPL